MSSTRSTLLGLLASVLHAVVLFAVALDLGYAVDPSAYTLLGALWRYGGLLVAAALANGLGPYLLHVGPVTVEVPTLVTAIGPSGIWWGFVVSNVAGAIIAYVWFRRGTWRDGDVRGRSRQNPTAAKREHVDVSDDD